MRTSGKTVRERSNPANIIQADFILSEFESAIFKRGNNVIFEKAYVCACKSKESDHRNICKNCGGVGYFFANPIKTKMLISGLVYNKRFEEMGAQDIGTVSVSAINDDKISFMDKIVLLDSTAEHSQVLYPSLTDDEANLFAYTKYDILSIDFIGLFVGPDQELQKLEEPADYSFRDNVLTFDPQYNNLSDPAITIRYKYNPIFHIIDVTRESMTSYNEARVKQVLPIHAIAQRAHLIKAVENYNGDRLLDNSWLPMVCEETEITKFNRQLRYTSAQDIYENLTSVQIDELQDLLCTPVNDSFDYTLDFQLS